MSTASDPTPSDAARRLLFQRFRDERQPYANVGITPSGTPYLLDPDYRPRPRPDPPTQLSLWPDDEQDRGER
jgi:hypothetical protein